MSITQIIKLVIIFGSVSYLQSCNGQSPEKELNFKMVHPAAKEEGQYLTFSRKFDFANLNNYQDDAQLVLISAKHGLLNSLANGDLPDGLITDSIVSRKVEYRLAYGIKVDDNYWFRWERTGPIMPKYVVVEVAKNNANQWASKYESTSKYFYYLSAMREKWHNLANALVKSKDSELLIALKNKCRIENLASSQLDCNCLISSINNLSTGEVEKMFGR